MAKRRRLIPAPFAPGGTSGAAALSGPLPRPPLAPIARVAGEASAASALQEVAAALESARAEGRLVQALPLGSIDTTHLVRDRIETDEEAMAQLMASLSANGQRSPIEVTELAPDQYGLISGWRRVTALRRLQEETGEARFATVLALLRRPETAEAAYVAMVEENEVRLGLSYYERARIAARAADLGVFDSEKAALQKLFASASRARRSKIGSFLGLYRALDAVLLFPAAIPERLGLALAQRLAAHPGETERLAADWAATPPAGPGEEQARLWAAVNGRIGPQQAETEAESDSRTPRVDMRAEEIRPGLFLKVSGARNPVIILSGPEVSPELRARLIRWLQEG